VTIDALQARVQAMSDDAAAKRTRNAEQMPESAELYRAMRAVFGNVAGTLTETGHTIHFGTRQPDRAVPYRPPLVTLRQLETVTPSGKVVEKRRRVAWEMGE
jgi:hypothetical protein